jgi:hypothetical protein
MYDVVQSSKKPFTAEILIQNQTYTPQRIRLIARDAYKPFTVFSERIVTLNAAQARTISMLFPVCPDYMEIYTYNNSYSGQGRLINPKGHDNSHRAEIVKTIAGVKQCDVWLDQDFADFAEFAEWFSLNAGLLSFGDYKSRNGKFWIRYMPYLTYIEKYTNKELKSNTPSRVGEKSGRIEVSREHFIQYSVPKRFIILLHEYMHKYGNGKYLGRKFDDENGADFLALYAYLGRGYPRIDARDVFLNIFYGNATEDNLKRQKMITTFIADFDSGKINNLCNIKTK